MKVKLDEWRLQDSVKRVSILERNPSSRDTQAYYDYFSFARLSDVAVGHFERDRFLQACLTKRKILRRIFKKSGYCLQKRLRTRKENPMKVSP